MESIRDILKAYRRATEQSQEQAARVFGVSVSCYQKWESGARTPSARAMDRIMETVSA